MTTTTRNQIANALIGLVPSNLTVDGLPYSTISRKFKHFDQVPQDQQPALFQTDPAERIEQKTAQLEIRRLYFNWTIYFQSDPSDPTAIGSATMNDIVDQLDALFPSSDPDQRQTLGGLVAHAFIEGEVIKIAGDQDGQGMVVVSITVLWP